MNVSAAKVREQIRSILNAWGMESGLVETTVEAMVETDLSGVDSHGISMLMDYEQSSRKGKLNLAAFEGRYPDPFEACDADTGHLPALRGALSVRYPVKAYRVSNGLLSRSH
jgi:LDH2 family malate/lactate/ureidoglycolate dehydrogenase